MCEKGPLKIIRINREGETNIKRIDLGRHESWVTLVGSKVAVTEASVVNLSNDPLCLKHQTT